MGATRKHQRVRELPRAAGCIGLRGVTAQHHQRLMPATLMAYSCHPYPLQGEWLPRLKEIVSQVSATFSQNFTVRLIAPGCSRVGCARMGQCWAAALLVQVAAVAAFCWPAVVAGLAPQSTHGARIFKALTTKPS